MWILDWNVINSNHNNVGIVLVISTAVLMASESIVAFHSPPANNNSAYAQSQPFQSVFSNVRSGSNSTLYAMGTSQIAVKPDKVSLSLAVETTNKTAEQALTANSVAMNKTLAALKEIGAPENETSTAFFNVSPIYNSTTRNITGYTVTNSINVESSDLANVSTWIDSAVSAGANTINSIDFSLSDKTLERTENMLLKEAIGNAKNKADIAALALGLDIVGVKSINVNVGYPPPAEPFLRQSTLAAAQSTTETADTPILLGNEQVTTSVEAVFIIG